MKNKNKKKNPSPETEAEQRIGTVAHYLYFKKCVPIEYVEHLVDFLVNEFNLPKGPHPEIDCARRLKNYLQGGLTELPPYTQKFIDDFEGLIAEYDLPEECMDKVINEIGMFNWGMDMGNTFF